MTHYLKAVSSAAPHLVRVFSIGKSKEGRPLLVAEVTNRNLREGREKPGIWVDGGHQGWNLLGSTACLELLRFLVAGHGRDEFLTELVDHTVFYIAPRLAPDEMEHCLKTGALLPQQSEGRTAASQEGRQFRVLNPLGGWKPFKRDNRIMVPRNPEDRKGPFFDLYRHLDSSRLQRVGPNDFPSLMDSEISRMPLQLPSTRAIFEFMRSYNNVFGVISTSGPGDRIRLISSKGDSRLINNLGQRLGELAGLPFSEAAPGEDGGHFLSWVSRSLGVLATDCQMWSLRTAAGVKEEELEDPLRAEETELIHLLRFCEKEFPEGSFGEWTETTDPLLGKGESGGWDWSQTWLNPPSGPYLGRELKKLSRLALGLASASPRIRIKALEEEVLGWSEGQEPLRRVTLAVENIGYMPTCPVETGQQLDGRVELNVGQNSLLMGQKSLSLKELRGIGVPLYEDGLPCPEEAVALPQRRVFEAEYLLQGTGAIEIVVTHPLAGVERAVSKPPQGLRPPSFDLSSSPAPVHQTEAPSLDPFEEVFPSFEELHQEPVAPPTPAPESRPTVELTPPRRTANLGLGDEFNIPDPPSGVSPAAARPVQFAPLDEPSAPAEKKSGPFPSNKPSQGRVFGSPPQKPTGGLPAALTGKSPGTPERTSSTEGEFSPLPLVKSSSEPSSAFEPMLPVKELNPEISSKVLGETIGGDVPAPNRANPPDANPSAPPARLSRMSAPQLLRRQRGGQDPREPFKRT